VTASSTGLLELFVPFWVVNETNVHLLVHRGRYIHMVAADQIFNGLVPGQV